MADTHEEQLLSELLGDIAREDAQLDAAHLETSVLASASFGVRERTPRSRAWTLLPVAAAVLAAFAMTVMVRLYPDATVRLKPDSTTDATTTGATTDATTTDDTVRRKPATPRATERAPDKNEVRSVRLQPDGHEGKQPDRTQSAIDARASEPSTVTSSIEFVPLMPITEHELTGSFQIVRVQMPSASLGALRSPLTGPNELVEADVLLGEDGRARAIRVNANESIYPWRPR